MLLTPRHPTELTEALARASATGGKVTGVDLAALNRVIEHTAEDMTVTVETGITLAALQAALGRHRQWLAVDPPNPHSTTIADIINRNLSGPRRFGLGTIRDYLLGIAVAMADGSVVHSGGKVVKNVAGYDLMKLFVGGQGTLGVPLEATFKLRPLPELEQFVETSCESLEKAGVLLESIMESEVTPVALELHNISEGSAPNLALVAGFAGTREEVEWQLEKAAVLGVSEPSSLDHEAKFWSEGTTTHRLSVLPSNLIEALAGLRNEPFVARAGNGIVYYRGEKRPGAEKLPMELMRRVKDVYDPRHIFPELAL
jgi:glycolate oxidase FAD binding subunit